MDPFTVVIGGMLITLIGALALIGRFYPGDGSEVLDWNPQRKAELDAQNEVDDTDEMLEAKNARRRKWGQSELTLDDYKQSLGL